MTNISTVVSVENISKQYRLSPYQPGARQQIGSAYLRDIIRHIPRKTGKIWALKDISFTIKKGESVGVIGQNGSGKSTLLRVLSGITQATEGCVQVHGSHAALFAVNAGFKMDLTGRKNIYLNAAISGILPRDIDKKIDDIIEFSELGDFIEQPVKRYSSGMRARLGFSIVIHTLPDIVFIDEALAAGDIRFREKCAERFQGLRETGITLLFASHSIPQVRQLCERVIWLDKGLMVMDGPTGEVVRAYKRMIGVQTND